VIERTFRVPVSRVWEALTDKDQMKQWYFDVSGFRPEVGFAFSFAGKGNEGEQTLLRLTHEGLETFPAGSPDFAPASFAKGWTYLIGAALRGLWRFEAHGSGGLWRPDAPRFRGLWRPDAHRSGACGVMRRVLEMGWN